MTGPLVNAAVIIVCSLIGCFLIKGIPKRFEQHIKSAIGIAIIFVGIKGALENENALLLVMSMVVGAVLGELVDIDAFMNRLGLWAQNKMGAVAKNTVAKDTDSADGKKSGSSFAIGFVSASVLFCAGSMAIVGSMQSGMQGNHEILFTKSILDGTISIIFAASFGIGVAFSSLPVLLYQGGIALASMALSQYLSEDMIREMSSVGSLLVAAIGFNFLGVKEIKVANLIPAVFVPIAWFALGF